MGKRKITPPAPQIISRRSALKTNSQPKEESQPSSQDITLYKHPNGSLSWTPFISDIILIKSNIFPKHQTSSNLPFKSKSWTSKLRHNKTVRNSKNIKNLSKDIIDGRYYQIYQDLEAGPSIYPKKKYCDYTGFETNYSEVNTGIRYYNVDIFRIFQNMSQPVKDQFLNIRKALIRLK